MSEILDIVHKLPSGVEGQDLKLNPPASLEQIELLEAALAMPLPGDFREFYSICNGFSDGEYLFRMPPIAEILDLVEMISPGTFVFAEYLIYSDIWSVVIAPPPEDHYFITTWDKPITNSLSVFLETWARGGLFGENGLESMAMKIK